MQTHIVKKVVKVILGLATLLVLIYAILAILAETIPDHPFFKQGEGTLVMAHQGGKKLRPDNTLVAYQNAWDLGSDVLEMDLHSTTDGVLVLMHDATVDDTTDGSGAIQDFNLRELQELDAGYRWTQDEGASYPFRGQGIRVPSRGSAGCLVRC